MYDAVQLGRGRAYHAVHARSIIPDADVMCYYLFRTYPSVGVQLRGGPVLVKDNNFVAYTSTGDREAYAIGFYPQNPGQFGSANTIGDNTVSDTVFVAVIYYSRY